MSQQESAETLKLPPLRAELRLHEAESEESGAPTWTLEDPVSNRFFRISRFQVELLSRWEEQTAEDLCRRVRLETALECSVEDVSEVQHFLLRNALLSPQDSRVGAYLEMAAQKRKKSRYVHMLQSYIFFRIPLWNPDSFLSKTLPVVRPFASRPAFVLYALIAVAALVLLTPQWSVFFATFPYFFSWQGLVLYLCALFVVKFFHELGHAYTAKSHGLKVPTIGVVFIVLWPLLYTDNNDAWKIRDRSVRLKIVLAGMLTEIVVAVLATFCWTFLPTGTLKSLCFVLATSSWISSLLINLSPFMRFDGYYFVSDYLGVANLAPRSFALGRWMLRKVLLGYEGPKPEYFTPRREHFLILFCYATWMYRAIVLMGIALMVYHLFFKALGVLLFGVEVVVFLIRPLLSELGAWWHLRREIGCNGHVVVTCLALVTGVALLVLPLPTRLSVPALLTAGETTRIFSPLPARLDRIAVSEGTNFKQGDLLFQLSSPNLHTQLHLLEGEIAMLRTTLQRELASSQHRDRAAVTTQKLAQALTTAEGYRRQMDALQILAPKSGTVTAVAPGLKPGSWVSASLPLCELVAQKGLRIDAYLLEQDLALFNPEASAVFYPENGDVAPMKCRFDQMDRSAVRGLPYQELASVYEGEIAVVEKDGNQVPAEACYKVSYRMDTPYSGGHRLPGRLVIAAPPTALVARLWRFFAPGLIRNSSF